ncbi:hypothetical protein SeLEV6574_g05077, partial [Synchytrium endobioticum]
MPAHPGCLFCERPEACPEPSKSCLREEMTSNDMTDPNPESATNNATAPAVSEVEKPFNLTVVLPGGRTKLDIPVSLHVSIQDIRQYLLESPESNFHTCFSLQVHGTRLSDVVTLEECKEFTSGDEMHMVPEPYSDRDVRVHISRFREVLTNFTNIAPPYGADAGISYLTAVSGENMHASLQAEMLDVSKHPNKRSNNDKNNKKSKNSSGKENGISPSPPRPPQPNSQAREGKIKHAFHDYEFEEIPSASLVNIVPENHHSPFLPCVKSIDISPWNPPPHYRRMMGDLSYLLITTLENERLHITCSASGFYVNSSTDTVFNPTPASPKSHHAHTLPALLTSVSPLFTTNFDILQQLNGKRHPFEYFSIASTSISYPWCVRTLPHHADAARTLDVYMTATDALELWGARDYNDDIQTSRELPHGTPQERIIRDATSAKLHSEFVDAAVKGAMAISKKAIQPINPQEPDTNQIYIHENIFFSAGADADGKLAELGGWEAAQVSISKDIDGIRALNSRELENCYSLGTALVDYAGRRILAQTIIPGLLRKSQQQQNAVSYGSVDSGTKEIASDPKFHELAKKVAEELRLSEHVVEDGEGKQHSLWTSIDTKGILGNDGRMYLLDLYRLTPVDVEWLDKVEKEKGDNKYPHKMVFLRHELVEHFVEYKVREFLMAHRPQLEAELQAEKSKTTATDGSSSVQKDNGATDTNHSDEQQLPIHNEKKYKEVNEMSDGESNGLKSEEEQREKVVVDTMDVDKPLTEPTLNELQFDLRMNPDAFTPVKRCGSDETIQAEDDLVRQASKYIVEQMIPSYILELINNPSMHPLDGESLTRQMHARGINMRYLGHLVQFFETKLPNYVIKYSVEVAKQEMVARACKKVMREYLRDTPSYMWSHCTSHFLNCLFRDDSVAVEVVMESFHTLHLPSLDEKPAFMAITPESLHARIQTEVLSRFRYTLLQSWWTTRRIRLLRSICIKVGIQIEARVYNFSPSATTFPIFQPIDIINLYPIVKSPEPKSSMAEEAAEHGKMAIAKGQKELGLELVTESVTIAEQVYGPVHPETGRALAQLAMIHFGNKDFEAARDLQKKAVIVMERTIGVDDPDVLQQYMNLGYFEYSLNNFHVGL